jgi:outer membrane usher protein FimD/PapC
LSNVSTLSLQSAFAYADGVFSVSRQVSDSFVTIVSEGSLAEVPLVVTRDGARTGRNLLGGRTVLADIPSYRPIGIAVEPEGIVLGLDEQALAYVIEPGYRSGTVIRLEAQYTVYAGGVLLDRDGAPVSYQLARWTGAEGSTGEFFTDENGYFEVYGMQAGDYTLTLPSDSTLVYQTTLRATSSEFVDLGELSPIRNPE